MQLKASETRHWERSYFGTLFNIGKETQLHYLCTLYRQQASTYIYKVISKDGMMNANPKTFANAICHLPKLHPFFQTPLILNRRRHYLIK